jgi:hypothetical protein
MAQARDRARDCCHREKERLKPALFACDSSFTDPKENQRCIRVVARGSAERARRCIRQA